MRAAPFAFAFFLGITALAHAESANLLTNPQMGPGQADLVPMASWTDKSRGTFSITPSWSGAYQSTATDVTIRRTDQNGLRWTDVTVGDEAKSVRDADFLQIFQVIPWKDTVGLNFGTERASALTARFKIWSNIATTLYFAMNGGGRDADGFARRHIVFAIPVEANQTKIVAFENIPGDTGGEWQPMGNGGLYFQVIAASGPHWQTAEPSRWGDGDAIALRDAPNLHLLTPGASFRITDCELRVRR